MNGIYLVSDINYSSIQNYDEIMRDSSMIIRIGLEYFSDLKQVDECFNIKANANSEIVFLSKKNIFPA